MRIKMKRFLGILLTLTLVLGLMPGMSMTAYATEQKVTFTATGTNNGMFLLLKQSEAHPGGTIASQVIEVKLLQPEKAYCSIIVTELGIVIALRPEQPLKAYLPILVTEFPIVAEVKCQQPLNVEDSIFVTEFGILTEVRAL